MAKVKECYQFCQLCFAEPWIHNLVVYRVFIEHALLLKENPIRNLVKKLIVQSLWQMPWWLVCKILQKQNV